MKIIKGSKYKVVIELHHFNCSENALDPEDFMLCEGEEYILESVYDMSGNCFVNLGTFKNDFNQTCNRALSIETFKNCFEKVE